MALSALSPDPSRGDEVNQPQPDLWSQVAARPAGGKRDTSRRAAASLTPSVVKQDEDAILAALECHGRLTRYELVARTGIQLQSICARLRGLVKAGRIEFTAASKPGPTGRPCRLYVRHV